MQSNVTKRRPRRLLSSTAFSILVFSIAPAAAAQTTWLVDSQGGGQFTTIQAAVDAASPGDRIEVLGQGPYVGFAVDKTLDIEALNDAVVTPRTVTVVGEGGFPLTIQAPCIEVTGLPSGQEAWITGFKASGKVDNERALIELKNCPGSVLLDDLDVPAGPHRSSALSTNNCQAVLVIDSRFRGGDGGQIRPRGYAGAVLKSSRVTLQQCEFIGPPGASSAIAPTSGGHALTMEEGVLFAYASEFRGGRGGDMNAQMSNTPPGDGGDGVRVEDSACPQFAVTRVVFSGGCQLKSGGPGTPAPSGVPPTILNQHNPAPVGSPGAALELLPMPKCILAFASDDSTFDQVLCGAPVACIDDLITLTANGLSKVEVPMGTSVNLLAQGQPNRPVALFVSGGLANLDLSLPLYAFLTPLLIANPMIQMAALTADSAGQANYSLNIPVDPAFSNRYLFFQALETSMQVNTFRFSNVLALRLR